MNTGDDAAAMCREAAEGLLREPPLLPPKFFYDDAGARLFDRITTLDAYYLTRTELRILERCLDEVASLTGSGARVIEFGSGSGVKTRMLLRALDAPAAYIPIDIAAGQLAAFASTLRGEFPALHVAPVAADYTGALTLPAAAVPYRSTLVFFPGSTIGNLERDAAERFLAHACRLAGAGGRLLIGADLHKDAATLERAYNDEEGVTAEFNLNVLRRLNRECGTDFDVASFRHLAVYDDAERRIEMRLVCTRPVRVRLPHGAARDSLDLAAGEFIITEYSHKFTVPDFRAMAERAGWRVERLWLDDGEWFSVWLLRAAQ